ncbi:M28 family peptidase [Phaeodactylibacter luteus]|uniref:M28 family peptidase n=2 Tax=Phaeodactylibacter luteus TaxID=1564516 RepID=A0A5C6S1X7_9BACT|nr:M28 family peptidase [Phaeodactylibacter luteus]
MLNKNPILMRPFFALALATALQLSLYAQNQPPQVAITGMATDPQNQTVTLTFNLSDPDDEALDVYLRAAPTGSARFNIIPAQVSGNIGFPVAPGDGLQLTWAYAGELAEATALDLKIIADDRYEIPISEMVAQVDSQLLRARLQQIDGPRHFAAAPATLNLCRDTIMNAFQAYGLSAYRQNFPYANTIGQNLIADHWGDINGHSTVIIDGHYDTVSDAPGADDNGSAVAGMLEAARILSAYHFRNNLRFIGFDLEEAGLRGSIHYVGNRPEAEDILGVLNMEMIGYFSDAPNSQTLPDGFALLFPQASAEVAAQQNRGNFLTNVAIQSSEPLRQAFDAAAAAYVPELRVISLQAPDGLVPPDLARSDHAPFWGAGLPALMLTDGADFRNPHYHEPSDTIGTLNFAFMSNCVKAVVATAAELAEPIHIGEAVASNLVLTHSEGHLHHFPLSYTLSPNPANGQLFIQFGKGPALQLEARLLDLQGRSVWRSAHATAQGSLAIPLQALPAGTYWVQLTDGHHYSAQQVVVAH